MTTARKTKTKSWRDVIDIHPAAEVFPLMSKAELYELAKNIRNAGLRTPVLVWEQLTNDGPRRLLLDGRNRLDAMELAGIPVVSEDNFLMPHHFTEMSSMSTGTADAVVVGLNIRRRHLTPAQQAKLLAEAVTANKDFLAELRKVVPLKPSDDFAVHESTAKHDPRGGSNRSAVADIAEMAGVHRHTARKALKEAEAKAAEAPSVPPPPPPPPKPARKRAPAKRQSPAPPAISVEIANVLVALKRARAADLDDQVFNALEAIEREIRRLITGRKSA